MDNIKDIYTQRNNCAIALAKAAVAAGWKAGRGLDTGHPDWHPSWCHVVYVDLPNGQQVSYHVSPDMVHLLDDLPVYEGEWDGTYVGRDPAWSGF